MAPPEFKKSTVDTIGRRAAFKCSNPDCRVSTVGPNTNPEKSTLIGEAAHIYGARPGSNRYVESMTDSARGEITNAIWLCRNCHKLIDSDEQKYSSDILFAWREAHESYTQLELGTKGDQIRFENQQLLLRNFEDYPPIVRRILIDRPDGWEWRLAAELMRCLNRSFLLRLKDLRARLYVKPLQSVGDEEILDWITLRMEEALSFSKPIVGLMQSLSSSFGEPGHAGNVEEIHHSCCLIRDYLEQIVLYEERLAFVILPDEFKNVHILLRDVVGSQAEKLSIIPSDLDDIVELVGTSHGGTDEDPLVIKRGIVYNVPDGWEEQMSNESIKAIKLFKNRIQS